MAAMVMCVGFVWELPWWCKYAISRSRPWFASRVAVGWEISVEMIDRWGIASKRLDY